MADYFTQLSCTFDVGSAEKAAAALVLLDELREDPAYDEPPYGFDATVDGADPGVLWIRDSDGQGDPSTSSPSCLPARRPLISPAVGGSRGR